MQGQDKVKGCICELKRKTSREISEKVLPGPLWDYVLELHPQIFSHTALSMYNNDGWGDETKLIGTTVNIINLYEIDWYQWVLFVDALIDWPDDCWVLDC